MKIAILSDIHGNIFALNEVLKYITQNNIYKIFVLGDIIGYYYNSKEILETLDNFDCEIIAGNHENMLTNVINNIINIEIINKKYGHGLEQTLKTCNKNQIEYLMKLPEYKILYIDGLKIGLFHGSPFKNDEYIYPDESKEKLDSLNNNNFDYIFIGHTHRPFVYSNEKYTLVNVGSVGQNRICGGIANWIIFDTNNKTIHTMSTKYCVEQLLNLVEKYDNTNEYMKNVLLRN